MLDRREFIAAGMGLATGARALSQTAAPSVPDAGPRLRQSVCRWCLAGMDLDAVCALAKRCGIESVELLDPEDILRVRDRGLACAIANGPCTIRDGLNRLEHHEAIVRKAETLFPQIAKAGCERVIVFAGDRAGLDDATGLWNSVVGVRRLLPIAEANNLVIAMELLDPEDILRVRDRGLACAIANGPCTIRDGLNRLEHHEDIVRKAETLFPQIAK
ncbi:MAG: Hydroxypyruvate isomerase, partial [Planctomycetota bacterium]